MQMIGKVALGGVFVFVLCPVFLPVTYDGFWLVVNYESPFLITAVNEFGARQRKCRSDIRRVATWGFVY